MPSLAGLHPLLRSRFSPLQFDPDHELSPDDATLLVEAARWAPSAGNSQPWGFFLARRGTPEHAMVVDRLTPSSRRWAPHAAMLVVNLAHRTVAGTDWAYSDFADYDVGQAVAHMTLQASAMGLACRQFRAFDLEGLAASLKLDEGWAIRTMTAIGGPIEHAPISRERFELEQLTAVARPGFPEPGV